VTIDAGRSMVSREIWDEQWNNRSVTYAASTDFGQTFRPRADPRVGHAFLLSCVTSTYAGKSEQCWSLPGRFHDGGEDRQREKPATRLQMSRRRKGSSAFAVHPSRSATSGMNAGSMGPTFIPRRCERFRRARGSQARLERQHRRGCARRFGTRSKRFRSGRTRPA